MTEPAQAQHGNDVAGVGAAVAQRVERREAGHIRGAPRWGKIRRHLRHRAHRATMLGVAAVVGETGDLTGHAGEEVPAAAVVTLSAISTIPANAHSLTRQLVVPVDRIDHTNYLIAGTPGCCIPGNVPSLVSTSLWQMPQARARIHADPGPGSRIGRSTISRGPLGPETCTTRIVAMISSKPPFTQETQQACRRSSCLT